MNRMVSEVLGPINGAGRQAGVAGHGLPSRPGPTWLVLVETCGVGATETQLGLMGESNPASEVMAGAELERATAAQTIERKWLTPFLHPTPPRRSSQAAG